MAPSKHHGWHRLVAVILSAPAGWMVFALLLPAAVRTLRSNWTALHDPMATPGDRAWAWALIALSALGTLACAIILLRVL